MVERTRSDVRGAAGEGGATDAVAHRRGAVRVSVTDADGAALPHTPVTVEQRRHDFAFGNIGFDLIGLANGDQDDSRAVFGGASRASAASLAPAYLDLFNATTLPFYWQGFEPHRGHPQTERFLRAAQWFADRGVQIKGHPLLWHTLAPQWLMDLDEAETEAVMRARITRETRDFAGLVDLWDAINEPVILPVFTAEANAVTRLAQSRGRIETIRMAFDSAREGNPDARLVLNDFDLSVEYERVIEECLAAGIQIDALGVQTHMHQGFRGEEEIRDILDRFARFGLPLHMTETTLVSGDLMPGHIVDLNDYQVDSWPSTTQGEDRQADEIVRHYRTVVEHPAVESLTYWGLTDEGSWLGAPSGLIRADGSRKPSYDALLDLIKREWWVPPTPLVTDASGVALVEGFAGDYRLTRDSAVADVRIERGASTSTTVTL